MGAVRDEFPRIQRQLTAWAAWPGTGGEGWKGQRWEGNLSSGGKCAFPRSQHRAGRRNERAINRSIPPQGTWRGSPALRESPKGPGRPLG